MSGNTLGTVFTVTTFGESHGPALGAVIDGVPPGIELNEEEIQRDLDRRRPGGSPVSTSRNERDRVEILSGVFEGKSTGTPLALLIRNTGARSGDYDDIADVFRPGHADYTYTEKYGIRDYRGGGRSSGRETAARVAAGAVARKVLSSYGIRIQAFTLKAAGVSCRDYSGNAGINAPEAVPEEILFDQAIIEANPMRAPDPAAAERMVEAVRKLAEKGDSAGGIVECRVTGTPPGLGNPVFDKLDAALAGGMLSLGAVKAIEFGSGFAFADMTGSESNDRMTGEGFETNRAGGVLGGISTGSPIVFRIAVKPTPSISLPQHTVGKGGEEREIRIRGRHDPCIAPRIVPVVEAMTAIILLDHLLLHRAGSIGPA
ncbi:MAG: chorismate synthase [Spirochaetia bacterium]